MTLFDYGNYEGIPFKLPIKIEGKPNIRAEDLERGGNVRVYVFDLSDPKQVQDYAKVRQNEADGLCEMIIDRQWSSENNNWKILAEVLEYYWTFTRAALEELQK